MIPSNNPLAELANNNPENNAFQQQNNIAISSNAAQLVQEIFKNTTCYDLMQSSSKGTVFETTIPFQLAFFALIEHDTDVAPLWDPEQRTFVGLMVVHDYINSMRMCLQRNISAIELTSKPISHILSTAPYIFNNHTFEALEVEDHVRQLTTIFLNSRSDYVPIIDPETENLVAILGPLDVLHLLNQIAKVNIGLFSNTLQSERVGTYRDIITAPKQALMNEVLETLHLRDISALPVLDEQHKVVGIYHKSDVSFIMKASDPEQVLINLYSFRVERCLELKEQLLQSGEIMSSYQGLVSCLITETIGNVLNALVVGRSTRAVVVDEIGHCVGIVSCKDLLRHYLEQPQDNGNSSSNTTATSQMSGSGSIAAHPSQSIPIPVQHLSNV